MAQRRQQLGVLIFGICVLSSNLSGAELLSRWCFLRADFSKVCFELETADEPEERGRGLMHRKSLHERGGMIFDFEQSQPIGMWMKNTFIPLDMIFLDAKRRVLFIHHQAVPHSLDIIRSPQAARYTVELNGGAAKTYGLGIGDLVFPEP